MKRQKKRLLGFFGLSIVAIMTVVAATIPGPGTSALTSVTDTIQITVVGDVPSVKFKDPDHSITTTDPTHTLLIGHENVDVVKVKIKRKGEDSVIGEYDYTGLNYGAGEVTTNINIEDYGTPENHGYGEYVISLYGVDVDGSEAEYDSIMVKYVPIIAGPVVQGEGESGDKDGKVTTKLEDYDDDNVETVDIYVDGKLVKTVTKDELGNEIEIPMDGFDSGDYNVKFVAKDKDGNPLYLPEEKPLHYKKKSSGKKDDEDIPVPGTADTGGLFKGLNISKEDYLTSGLIVFFVFGVVAFGIVARNGNNRKTKNYKKKR